MGAKRARFAQSRKSAGYSQEKLAQVLGVERSTVVRWEAAETEPQPWVRPKVAAALGVTRDELQQLLDEISRVADRPSDDRLAHALERPSAADLVAAAHLQEHVRRLDDEYDLAPSTALLGPAGHVHGQVKFLRENASDPRIREALLAVQAVSATLIAQLVWDASHRRDHTAPVAYLNEAIAAARHAHEPSTEAYATLRKSFIALYGERNPIKGAALARQAAKLADGASPSLTGLSHLHVAEGHAMTGDVKACEEAMKIAEGQLDHTDEDAAAQYYTVNEFRRLTGSCYLFLGLPDRAEPVLRTTVQALATKKKSQAIALGNLTLPLIRQRKLDEGAAAFHRTIDAVEVTRGGGGLNLAFAAGRELRQWRQEPWARDINDRLLALMAAI